MSNIQVSTRRRSSRRIFVPAILLLVLAAGWSVFWWYASNRAAQIWDQVVAREAERGVVITCEKREFGGFPFRFEARCDKPAVDATSEDRPFKASAAQFTAVFQIWQPNKLILEATGPLTAEVPDEGRSIEATWTAAQASLSIWLEGPDQFRLVVDGLATTEILDNERRSLAKADKAEIYARRSAVAGAAPGSFDLSARLTKLVAAGIDERLGDSLPVESNFAGLVTGLVDWRPKPTPVFLRDWAAAGGSLHIDAFRVDRGPISIIAAGDLKLDAEGRANGKGLTITLAGVSELVDTLGRSGLAPGNLGNFLGVGLAMAGKPGNIDGRPAVEVPLSLTKGKFGVAGIPLGSLPRVFVPQ